MSAVSCVDDELHVIRGAAGVNGGKHGYVLVELRLQRAQEKRVRDDRATNTSAMVSAAQELLVLAGGSV